MAYTSHSSAINPERKPTQSSSQAVEHRDVAELPCMWVRIIQLKQIDCKVYKILDSSCSKPKKVLYTAGYPLISSSKLKTLL